MAGNGKLRSDVKPGLEVDIVLKQDQRTGKLTRGIVKDLLTNSAQHPHGIKVRLQEGQVGRVQHIIGGGVKGD
ncbi:MAG: YwbE family protein [Candidatus Cohnella colombiensis]|uniref:YwbE family protein n=1 Tax=Candidatus Cohnella colombiensis TaxID=3121368 RepID=A0AA95EVH8_9BACL|nr:MAG: YwbE family protein [Cohnella sp.]